MSVDRWFELEEHYDGYRYNKEKRAACSYSCNRVWGEPTRNHAPLSPNSASHFQKAEAPGGELEEKTRPIQDPRRQPSYSLLQVPSRRFVDLWRHDWTRSVWGG